VATIDSECVAAWEIQVPGEHNPNFHCCENLKGSWEEVCNKYKRDLEFTACGMLTPYFGWFWSGIV